MDITLISVRGISLTLVRWEALRPMAMASMTLRGTHGSGAMIGLATIIILIHQVTIRSGRRREAIKSFVEVAGKIFMGG